MHVYDFTPISVKKMVSVALSYLRFLESPYKWTFKYLTYMYFVLAVVFYI